MSTNTSGSTPFRFLFFKLGLEPGVTKFNMGTYILATILSMVILTFTAQAQAHILTEVLNIPESTQGSISGQIGFVMEVIIMLSIGWFGTVSDKVGRKVVFGGGFLLSAIGHVLLPFSSSLPMLFIFRSFAALGSSAISTMLVTVVADYARDKDRGKASGIQGLGNGIGALITVMILLGLFERFEEAGATPIGAVQSTYFVVAGIALLAALIMFIGLQGRTEVQAHEKRTVNQIAVEGIRAMKDPGVALAYAAAFVSRGDLAIVGTFLTLWIRNYGMENAGLTPAEALTRAGIVIAIAQSMALISAPIFGALADRMNRVVAVVIAVGISTIGYGSTLFVDDALGPMMFISAALIGLGEVGGVISSGVLIAQQAPRKIRGSVIGFFSFSGAVGIMTANLVGGYFFDAWRPAAPFLLFSAFGFIVVIWGLIVKNKVVPVNKDASPAGGH